MLNTHTQGWGGEEMEFKTMRSRAYAVLGGACNPSLGFYEEDPKITSVGLTVSTFDIVNNILL